MFRIFHEPRTKPPNSGFCVHSSALCGHFDRLPATPARSCHHSSPHTFTWYLLRWMPGSAGCDRVVVHVGGCGGNKKWRSVISKDAGRRSIFLWYILYSFKTFTLSDLLFNLKIFLSVRQTICEAFMNVIVAVEGAQRMNPADLSQSQTLPVVKPSSQHLHLWTKKCQHLLYRLM